MPYKSQDDINNLGQLDLGKLIMSHTPIGYDPRLVDRKFLLPTIDRYAGTYVIGKQGMGKSALLINMILHDIYIGHSVIVLDPHGDLITNVIARMRRWDGDFIHAYMLDMEDTSHPFGLNILHSLQTGSSVIQQTQAIDRVMQFLQWSGRIY